MRCADALKQIRLYIDGRLPNDDAALLRRHLEGCAECAREFASLAEADQLLKGLLTTRLPEAGFADRVMARISESAGDSVSSRPAAVSFWKRYGAVGAAAAILVAIGMFGILHGPLIDDEDIDPPPLTVAEISTVSTIPKDTAVSSASIAPTAIISAPPAVSTISTAGPAGNSAASTAPIVTTAASVSAPNPVSTATSAPPATIDVPPDDEETTEPPAPSVTPTTPSSGVVVLPNPIHGVELTGNFETTRLTPIGQDAFYPYFNREGELRFLIKENDSFTVYAQDDLSDIRRTDEALPSSELIAQADSREIVPADGFITAVSPDHSMVASNDGREGEGWGVWYSGSDSALTANCGGKILSWSPDSGKFVFSDAAGLLYAVYPQQDRIILVSDSPVYNVCWYEDSKHLFFDCLEADGARSVSCALIP